MTHYRSKGQVILETMAAGRDNGRVQNTQPSSCLSSELQSSVTLIALPASRNSNYGAMLPATGVQSNDNVPSDRITVKSSNIRKHVEDDYNSKNTPLRHVTSPFKAKKPRGEDLAFQKLAKGTFGASQGKLDDAILSNVKDLTESSVAASKLLLHSIIKETESVVQNHVSLDDIEQGKANVELKSGFVDLAASPFIVPQNNAEQKPCCGSAFAARWIWTCLGPYKIPLILFVIIYILLVTSGASFLLKRSFALPGLRTQVARLEANIGLLEVQVDRFTIQVDALETNVKNLSGQVDRLHTENDRFAAENDKLLANNAEYTQLNSQLGARNQEYKALNGALNVTVENYRFLNQQLHQENEHYQNLNEQLNQTVRIFSSEVASLQDVRDNLTSSVNSFQNLTDLLQSEVGSFSQQNAALNGTVAMLQDIKYALEANNEYYRQLNGNLSTVVSFLNATSSYIGDTFDSIVAYLSHTIIVNRNLVLNQLYLTMRQIVNSWRCGITDTFLEPWVDSTTTSIGIKSYRDVLSYANTTVFSHLCISLADFELFLGNRFPLLQGPSNISLIQLSSGVNVYTTAILKYYFPGEKEFGLTVVDWDEANFKCSSLPRELRFSLYGQR